MIQNEVWKDVPDYEGLYQVNNFGNVRSYHNFGYELKKEPRTMKPLKTRDGYLYLTLCKDTVHKNMKVHRIVAMAFIPNELEELQIDHINGIKTDNRVSNLEWVTPKENTLRSVRLGLKPRGEKHGNSKLTYSQVERIRDLYKTGQYSHRQIGKMFGISHSVAGKIIRNELWKSGESCHIKRYSFGEGASNG
jgi:hypothetical protein